LALLEQASGSILEETDVEMPLLREAVVEDGRVVGPLADGRLAAWDLGHREFVWHHTAVVRADFPVALADGVLVAVEDHAVAACDLVRGNALWRFEVGQLARHRTILDGVVEGHVATRVIAHDGRAWVGLTGGWVVAMALADGSLLWRADVGSAAGMSLDLDPDGALVVVAYDQLIVLDANTGEQRGRYVIAGPTPVAAPFAPIALSTDLGWTVDRRGRLNAINLDDGRVADQINVGAFVHEPPLVADQGVYVTDFKGSLHAYGHLQVAGG
jgi:outer membrane protein assembly factor BamB